MAFTFPTDKADFTAPNGITYSWDATDEKWVVKTYKADESALEDYVLTDDFLADQQRQDDVIEGLSGEFSIRRSYQVNRYVGGDGYLNTNSLTPSNITTMIFGDLDIGGRATPTLKAGDSIRVANISSSNTNDYEVTDVNPSDPTQFLVVAKTNVGSWNDKDNCTVTFSGTTSAGDSLAQRVTEGEATQAAIQSTVNTALGVQADIQAEQSQQNNSIDSLQNQIDDLGITKGALATYQCAAVALPYNARNGECLFSDATASAVVVLGFGVEDKNGQLTKPILDGDIVEVETGGVISRYKVLDGSQAPQMVAVEFVSGDQTFALGTEYDAYIYPQNEAGASKEYVDAQDEVVRNYVDDSIAAIPAPDLSGYVSKTGNQVLTQGSTWRLRQDDSADNAKTFLTINDGAMNLYHLADPTADTHAANQKYVKEQRDTRLPLTGGMLTGDLAMNGNKITALGAPTQGAQAANKSYVDDEIGKIVIPDVSGYLPLTGGSIEGELIFNGGDATDNLSIYPNQSNDDSTITALNGSALRFRTVATNDHLDTGKKTHLSIEQDSSGVPITKIYHLADAVEDDQPATLKQLASAGGSPSFIWERVANTTLAEDLTAGQFFVADNGNIYFHPTTDDGIDLQVDSTATQISGVKMLASVHDLSGESKYLLTWTEMDFNGDTSGYMRLKHAYHHITDVSLVGQKYRLNIPGFTF